MVRIKQEANSKLLNARKRNKIYETNFVASGFLIKFAVGTANKTVCR
jgi:hypothetical protein